MVAPVSPAPARRSFASRFAIWLVLALGLTTTLATSPARWNIRAALPPTMLSGDVEVIELEVVGDAKTLAALDNLNLTITFVDVDKAERIRETVWMASLGSDGAQDVPVKLAPEDLVGFVMWLHPTTGCAPAGRCAIPLKISRKADGLPPLQLNIEVQGTGLGNEAPGDANLTLRPVRP